MLIDYHVLKDHELATHTTQCVLREREFWYYIHFFVGNDLWFWVQLYYVNVLLGSIQRQNQLPYGYVNENPA